MTWNEAFGHAVALVGHLAWPAVAVVAIALLRRELATIVSSLARRIRDPGTTVTVGREGFTLQQTVAEAEVAMDRLVDQITTDPAFETRLHEWLKANGVRVSITSFLYGQAYRSLREAAVRQLTGEG